ncbi:excalibur calcium-binding domain-containing protein [Bacillus salipaludis]|uniref:Excalibur calcium-binding domain-containing protein n=1 Tax=Bacillus salipaludis TaxID=2547811 RepID=A0AA90TWG2_9BACI|nr:excalibur calcium-binding domain-containing protein [Bacillus salipaludis]MDQ6600733.1 excalibur calcium-binding domain-containing protein [Bacillus salipaludis]
MKKTLKILISVGMTFGLVFAASSVSEAKTKIITYKNCTALNKVYKGGVAKSSKIRNKGGKTHYKPFVSSALYNANKKSDRDKDGIACER